MDENMRSRLAESVRSFHIPRLGEIPNVGLYLEQVTRYVNQSITGCGAQSHHGLDGQQLC